MTPDIKGLVERLREVVGIETGLLYSRRKLLTEAADALERLSTPPAVPVTPVAWEDIAACLFGSDGNGFYPMDCTSETQRRAYEIRAKDVAALYAAPVPAHSDVREALRGLIEAVERDANGPDQKGISGFTSARLSDARAALSTTAQSGWQLDPRTIEECAKALENEADNITNSLHCGDNHSTIASAHRHSRELYKAASILRALAPPLKGAGIRKDRTKHKSTQNI